MSRRLRWAPEQRLEFIEFRLFWDGWVNRSDLMDRFGVSEPQASKDLSTYRELAPANLEYDSSRKRYVAASSFRPLYLRPNPDRYLAQLKALSDGILDAGDTWIDVIPPAGVVPVPARRSDSKVLRSLLGAIRDGSAIHVEYQSMSREHPEPLWRWITPHAFGFDGLRWHVRAYCHRQTRFLDFVLGRVFSVGENGPAGGSSQDDLLWQEFFNVQLEPNPQLTDAQRRGVSRDYGMVNDRLTVPVRCALLYYFNKRLRFDVGDIDGPHERPVVIANRSEFDAALLRATARADAAERLGADRGAL
jgi:predicted DNA-binding transcriptional regulator YafY